MKWLQPNPGILEYVDKDEQLCGRVDRTAGAAQDGPGLDSIRKTAQQLHVEDPTGSYLYIATVCPPGSVNIGAGTFMLLADAVRAVERWWEYWLRQTGEKR